MSVGHVDHEASPGTPPVRRANAMLGWLRDSLDDLSYQVRDAFGQDARGVRG